MYIKSSKSFHLLRKFEFDSNFLKLLFDKKQQLFYLIYIVKHTGKLNIYVYC